MRNLGGDWRGWRSGRLNWRLNGRLVVRKDLSLSEGGGAVIGSALQ